MANRLKTTTKGGTVNFNIGAGLNRKEYRELANLLRKNMLYQTPRPVFSSDEDDRPTWVDLRFVFDHQQRILQLLHKHGGWTLPKSEKDNLLRRHEERARAALGDGTDYDLSHLTYGEMVAMYRELDGINELAPFREAIGEALAGAERGCDA